MSKDLVETLNEGSKLLQCDFREQMSLCKGELFLFFSSVCVGVFFSFFAHDVSLVTVM